MPSPRELEALFSAMKIAKPSRLQKTLGGALRPIIRGRKGNILQRMLSKGAGSVVRHPGGALLGGLFGAQMVGQPLVEGIARDFGYGYEEQKAKWDEVRRGQLAEEMRMRRLQRTISENTTRLMTYEPELAQQILAGRVLPQGAVVIGGRPRTDLLAQVAEGMSTGAYQQPDQGPMGGLL